MVGGVLWQLSLVSPSAGESVEGPSVELSWSVSDADGTAHAELDRSTLYMFCAVSPTDDRLIAGCTSDPDPLNHSFGRPVTLHIVFSHGRACLGAQDPAARTAPNPGADTEATVAVIATQPAFPSYANALGELVWTYLDPNQDIAIIADADMGRWWDTVSDGSPAALDHDPNHPNHPIHVAFDAQCCDEELGNGGITALDEFVGGDGSVLESLPVHGAWPADYPFPGE